MVRVTGDHIGWRTLVRLSVLLIGLGACSTVFPGKVSLAAAEEQVYYGYVPENITGVESTLTWRVDRGLLLILGNHGGTRVKVYALPEKRQLREFTVNRMENVTLTLPNATLFKVVSDKPVSVILMGGGNLEILEAMISTFFTSTEGGYIGREFIFPSVHGKTMAYVWRVFAVIPGLPFKVYALEESNVQVWDANGTRVYEFHLGPNKFRELQFTPFRVYRLTSTGNVMLQTFTQHSSTFYPAVEGGFVGTLFYGASVPEEFLMGNLTFIATSTGAAKLTPVNLEYERRLDELNVPAGGNLSFILKASHVAVKSDRPILFVYKSDDLDGGVASMGLKAGQTAILDVPPGYTYAFTYKETVVHLDDVTLRLRPDGALPISQGVHRISASENLLIQVTNIVKGGGINAFGTCLPSAQSLDTTYEGLRLKPLASEELPWTYIAAGAVVAIVAAFSLVGRRRRRSPAPPASPSGKE